MNEWPGDLQVNEKAIAAALYDSISKQLKEKIRSAYPEIDQWGEADAIELCLAYGRALKEIWRREDFEIRRFHHNLG